MATKSELILQMKAIKGNTNKVLNGLIKKLDETEESVEDLGEESEKSAKKMEKSFGKAFKSMRSGINKAVKVAAVASAAVGAMLFKAVASAREFQTGMAEVSTLLGKDAPALMKKYEQAVKDLASTSSSSASELSKGLYQVISAGTKGTETAAGSMKLLEVAQKAAVAGVSDVFSSVDVITTSLNAYQKSAENAEFFSDQLFTTVRLGKVTFNDLAAGLGTVASSAAGANISFGEVNAAIAAMTAGGVPSARAITSLNGIIRVAAKGSKELTKAFGETTDKVLKRDGLVGVLQKLKDVTGGSTIAMQKLGIEQEAITGLSVLASSGIDKFKSALVEMNNAAGATDVAYQKMSKTFDEQLKKFWNKLEVIMIEVGTDLMPTIQNAMVDFGNYVSENKDEIIETFKGMATALGFVAKAIGMVAKGWGALATAIKEGGEVSMIGRVVKKAEWLAHWQNEYNKRIVRTGTLFGGLLVKQKEAIALGIQAGRARLAGAGLLELGGKGMDALGGLFSPDKPAGGGGKEIVSKEEEAAKKKALAAIEKLKKAQETAIRYIHNLRMSLLSVQEQQREKIATSQVKTIQKVWSLWRQGLISYEQMQEGVNAAREVTERQLAKIRLEEESKFFEIAYKHRHALAEAWAAPLRELMENLKNLIQYKEAQVAGTKKAKDDLKEMQYAGGERGAQIDPARAALSAFYAGYEISDEEKTMVADIFKGWLKEGVALDKEEEDLVSKTDKGGGIGGMLSDVATGFMESAGSMLFNWAGTLVSTLASGKDAVKGLVDTAIDFWESLADNLDDALIYLAEEGIPKIIDSVISNLPKITEAIIKNIPTIVVAIARAVFNALSEILDLGIGGAGGDAVGGALTGAGLGAAVGSVIPGVGTAVGAGVGAIVGGIASLFHEGGFVDFKDAITAHSGMFVQPQASSNIPAFLEAGEGVIRKEIMAAMGGEAAIDSINAGKGVGGTVVVNNNLSVNHMLSDDTPQVLDRMNSDNYRKGVGRMTDIIDGSEVTGLEFAK